MEKYKVVEKFVSINGEGKKAGQLAVFIRFFGCNLDCTYCDTKWANEKNAKYESMTKEEIFNYIRDTKVKNITLTGGEPLIQKDIKSLIEELIKNEDLYIEIETNGSVSIKPYINISDRVTFTIDYKLSASDMEKNMLLDNYQYIKSKDTIKFVVANTYDLGKTNEIILNYLKNVRCGIYISPVYNEIKPADIVTYMIENNMNDVNLQLQLHKIIWDPDKKGV